MEEPSWQRKKQEEGNNNGGGSVVGWQLSLALLLFGAAFLFVAVDPFRLSVVANDPAFHPLYVEQPPLSFMLDLPRDPTNALKRAEKRIVKLAVGPESLAFDPSGKGPYTGVSDGRILRWEDDLDWTPFATTSPNRSSAVCDFSPNRTPHEVARSEDSCGRPLGLRFDSHSGKLFIADAYFGLLEVGPDGGVAKQLVSEVDGVPLKFTNDLDIASSSEGPIIYFTDSSAIYQRRNFFMLVLSGEASGRVIKYDSNTGQATVLLRGLQFPNGVTLSKDESFLVIAESVTGRLLRYWLKGPDTGKVETFTVLPGYPDNVRRNEEGDMWVALHCRRNWATTISGMVPWVRRAFLQLPIPFKQVYRIFNGGGPHGMLVKVHGETGQILEVLEDKEGNVVKFASEVTERRKKNQNNNKDGDDRELWIGSVLLPYISIYQFHSH